MAHKKQENAMVPVGRQQLAVLDRIHDPLDYAKTMSDAASSLMQAPREQGTAIAMASLMEGMNLMEFQRRYHWIEGQPSMQSHAMLAEFRMNWGGSYEDVENSADACEMRFTDANGKVHTERFTWQEALEEDYIWAKDKGPGDEPTKENLKYNWRTPRRRRSMLRSRVISDGLKIVQPELVAGVYTPEEVMDFKPSTSVVESHVSGPAGVNETTKVETQPTTMEALGIAPAQASNAVASADGSEGEPVSDEYVIDVLAKAQSDLPAEPQGPKLSEQQQIAIESYFEVLNVPIAAQAKALQKRGVTSYKDLTQEAAADLISRLKEQAAARGITLSKN